MRPRRALPFACRSRTSATTQMRVPPPPNQLVGGLWPTRAKSRPSNLSRNMTLEKPPEGQRDFVHRANNSRGSDLSRPSEATKFLIKRIDVHRLADDRR